MQNSRKQKLVEPFPKYVGVLRVNSVHLNSWFKAEELIPQLDNKNKSKTAVLDNPGMALFCGPRDTI